MRCFHPISAWEGEINWKTGKRPTVFNQRRACTSVKRILRCGRCIGCRLTKSSEWAIRCMHEASLHEHNCFLNLTYSTPNLPANGSLDYRHFQLFMKRLRKKFGSDIRFYMCGEYGDKFGRPHYHALIFGLDFSDKYPWRKSKSGNTLYRSPSLEKLWTLGNCEIGTVTFESAAYCARYIMKKVTGKQAAYHYTDFDEETGEVYAEVSPEFSFMSRRPGIAKGWFDKFHSTDVAPNDFVVFKGRKYRPPRYYDSLYEVSCPDDFEMMKERRRAYCNSQDSSPDRLRAQELVAEARLSRLPRSLD